MARQQRQISGSGLAAYMRPGIPSALGGIPDGQFNPVWLALQALAMPGGDRSPEQEAAASNLAPLLWKRGVAQKTRVMRAYVLHQTACLNSNGGAIGTGDLGTIRQRWYFSKDPLAMGFKFAAQALEKCLIRSAGMVLVDNSDAAARAQEMGAQQVEFKATWTRARAVELADEVGCAPYIHIWPKEGWGRAYACLQSKILATLVREGLTYDELWVRDASRDVQGFPPLLPDFYGSVLLEKQGLFEHFQGFCLAAGVPVLLAMSGANAFSGVEAILNDHFRMWEGDYKPTPDNPLRLLVISDHDYSGHVPIQGGAAAQFERYLPGAVEVHRVGVTPEQVEASGRSVESAGYEFNASRNRATAEWAEEWGVWRDGICYALEVEALEPGAYAGDLVDAIIEACGGDEELRKRLLEMAEPDWWEVMRVEERIVAATSLVIRQLRALSEWAEEAHEERRQAIADVTEEVTDEQWQQSSPVRGVIEEATEEQGRRISADGFKAHVISGEWTAYSPVSAAEAVEAVAALAVQEFAPAFTEIVQEIDTSSLADALSEVMGILEIDAQ